VFFKESFCIPALLLVGSDESNPQYIPKLNLKSKDEKIAHSSINECLSNQQKKR
jgi:hypothetical protein